MSLKREKVFIIAEAGVNHNGSMEIAKKLIDAAVNAGVDAVKFQTFITENIVSKDAEKADYQKISTGNTETQFQMIKNLQLSFENFIELKTYCEFKGIMFLSTPFDLDSVEFLKTLNMGIWKIPSGEITNLRYLQKIGSFNEEIIFSTGMSDLEDIKNALEVLIQAGTDKDKISILHCNTEYPTPFNNVNLNAMRHIKDQFKVRVGYSDHTLGIEVPIAAVALGAEIVEKHFTLDRNMTGPDHKASLDPNDLKEMVSGIRNIELAISGSGMKELSDSEKKNKSIVRKSLHYNSHFEAGHILTEKDLVALRPGIGISPMRIDDFIGRELKVSVKANNLLSEKHVK